MRDLFRKPRKPWLIVHKDLPKQVMEHVGLSIGHVRQASGYVEEDYKNFYYCPQCQGWIEGWPVRHYENSLAPHVLAGRSGYAEDCERCGYELDFSGIVS